MSEVVSADQILDTRGVKRDLGAFVVGAAFDRTGFACAFALGDGSLRIAPSGDAQWASVAAHDGAVLSLAAGAVGRSWASGGDDGRFVLVNADGTTTEIAKFGMKWVEKVAAHADAKAGRLACAVGKRVHVFWLSGFIFFGSSNGLFERIKRVIEGQLEKPVGSALPRRCG